MGERNIKHLKNNPEMKDQFVLKQDIVYSEQTGEELKLTVIAPWDGYRDNPDHENLPLLVFVQGSAWTTPDFNFEIPQLALFAHAGFVVATVGHRDCRYGHPFPGYLQDVKCAIRFLRKNAAEYCIDPDRVVMWGTSSGGNTAMLVGTTGDDPRYETEEHAGYSDKVDAVVSCFGPTDMIALAEPLKDRPEWAQMGAALAGSADPAEWDRVGVEMSPVSHVEAGKEYPPFLLLNGTGDMVVPHDQMERMYDKLVECNVPVTAYYVDGAEHEGNFWTPEVKEIILNFLKAHV